MTTFFNWISEGLGWILHILNNVTGNYGIAIILFTVIVRAALFPLTMKQMRSTAKMQELQPKLNALQKKYANDKDKFAKEQMKLYQEAGTSPFSGCLPTLIQMPILFCLYYAMMYPLKNQLHIAKSLLPQIAEGLDQSGYNQLNWVVEQVKNGTTTFFVEGREYLLNFNFNFLGVDLGSVASLDHFSEFATYWPNYVLSLLAGVLTFLSMKLSNSYSKKRTADREQNKKDDNPAAGMGSTMQYLMPAMTLWFTTFVPTAMTLYWSCGNLIQIIQQVVTNKMLEKDRKLIEERLAAEKAESERRRQLFAEEKVAASLNNMSKKKQKRLKEAQKEKDHQERLDQRNQAKADKADAGMIPEPQEQDGANDAEHPDSAE